MKPSIIFEVTNSCNLNCTFCYQSIRRNEKFITPEKFTEVLNFYKPLYLQLTGGEITTHPDFGRIIAIAIRKAFMVQISTNGLFYDKIIKAFKEIDIKKRPIVSISLDIPDERYDLIRGINGMFSKITNSLNEYRKNKIPFGFSTTVFDKNILPAVPEGTLDAIPALITYAEKNHAPMNIQPYSPSNETFRKKLGEILIKINSPYLVNSIPYRKLLIKGHKGKCKYLWTNISIGANGEVLNTQYNNCYFCNDCMKCHYSCVWEPTLLTSIHIFHCAIKLFKVSRLLHNQGVESI